MQEQSMLIDVRGEGECVEKLQGEQRGSRRGLT
jgi:hypothetical protein